MSYEERLCEEQTSEFEAAIRQTPLAALETLKEYVDEMHEILDPGRPRPSSLARLRTIP